MPSPTTFKQSPTLHNITPAEASPTSAASSSLTVFNKNALETANSPLSPQYTLSGTDTNGDNAYVVPLPTGSAAIDLSLFYFDGTLTILPKVRVFGAIPAPKVALSNSSSFKVLETHPLHPSHGFSSLPGLLANNLYSDWTPLSDADDNFLIEIGSSTDLEAWVDVTGGASSSGWSRTTSKTIFTRGATHVLVLVSTAATGFASGFLAGHAVY